MLVTTIDVLWMKGKAATALKGAPHAPAPCTPPLSRGLPLLAYERVSHRLGCGVVAGSLRFDACSACEILSGTSDVVLIPKKKPRRLILRCSTLDGAHALADIISNGIPAFRSLRSRLSVISDCIEALRDLEALEHSELFL